MRIAVSIFVWLAVLLSGGCAIWEKETTNRGGFLDHVLDEHWLKADSKGMRALRAFAIQVSLARIASVSAKNDSDRQLLAIRIGALTKRFSPIYACAFDTNPLGVPGAERDPCFYYDSAMVDYSTGLFDLAMIALPIDDAKRLVNIVTGSFVNPLNVADLLNALLAIGRDALKYGRVVGALYRDTVELEVQLWLATPVIDDRPPPYRVSEADVAALRAIYARRNDDLAAWLAAIAALRSAGLEPLPQRRFFAELGGLMRYMCDLITKDADALRTCKSDLPATLPPPASVLNSPPSVRVGSVITTSNFGAPAGRTASPSGRGRNPPADELARDAAARELDIFLRPAGPGTPPDTQRQALLEGLLKQVDPGAPRLLTVIRIARHQDLRDRLLVALRARPPGGGTGERTGPSAPGGQTPGVDQLARDASSRELDAFVRPGGPGTTPDPARQAKLERLLKEIDPNTPSVLTVIRIARHADLRDQLLAALKANP